MWTGAAQPRHHRQGGPQNYEEARRLFEALLPRMDEALGSTNDEAMQARNNYAVTLGKLGDWVDFSTLPQSLRSSGLAEALGVTIEPATSTPTNEVCGSAGEVANEPLRGHKAGPSTRRAVAGQLELRPQLA